MLYLGIDQHARQITISLRNEDGDVIQARQVSTRPEKINEFFQKLTRERPRDGIPSSIRNRNNESRYLANRFIYREVISQFG